MPNQTPDRPSMLPRSYLSLRRTENGYLFVDRDGTELGTATREHPGGWNAWSVHPRGFSTLQGLPSLRACIELMRVFVTQDASPSGRDDPTQSHSPETGVTTTPDATREVFVVTATPLDQTTESYVPFVWRWRRSSADVAYDMTVATNSKHRVQMFNAFPLASWTIDETEEYLTDVNSAGWEGAPIRDTHPVPPCEAI